EVPHFAGQHDAGPFGQLVLDPLPGMEERGGDLAATGAQGDTKQLVPWAVSYRKQHRLGDLVDECDVLAFRRTIIFDATHSGALDVTARIGAGEVGDGANAQTPAKGGR